MLNVYFDGFAPLPVRYLMSYVTSSYVIFHIILCHMSHHLVSYVTSSYVFDGFAPLPVR